MEEEIIIRRARKSDARHLPEIERSAGELFRTLPHLAWIADDRVVPYESYAEPIASGTVWVAEAAGRIAGLLLAETAGDVLHIDELAVAQGFQQRGIGRQLLDAAAAYVRVAQLEAMTLTTFRDVAWNAPFYARYGFAEVAKPDARLQTHLNDETGRGLPNRCAMRFTLSPLAFDVSKVVRNKVLLMDQAPWLAGLGETVADLATAWDLRIGTLLTGGTEAVVIEADTASGERAVLKLCIPGMDDTQKERRVLDATNGRGYARLIRHDVPRKAMLLERLGPQLHDLGFSSDQKLEAICGTLTKAWMPCPQGEPFPSGAKKAEDLARMIETLWHELGKPCKERTIAMALDFAKIRAAAFDARTAVLAHGDAHEWNTLKATEGFKFVDPDGLHIERAYDLGISMRENATELLAGDPVALGRRRCRLLAQQTGVAEDAIWQWGFIERVATGLYCVQLDFDSEDDKLAVADAWSAAA